MAPSSLRRPEASDIDYRISDRIISRPESRSCRLDHILDVVGHRGHILDQHERRSEHLGGARHQTVEPVSPVCASGVIVEVGMSLAGWSTNENIKWAYSLD